jgi:hypothetical protein
MSFLSKSLIDVENPSRDDIALDLGEPQFHLIEPGGIDWGEMQMNVGMTSEELFDLRSFMGREIIGDDVDFLTVGLMSDEVRKESHEFCRGVALSHFTQHFARAGVESSIQRKSAMTVVLKAVAFGSTRGEGQHGVFTIQSLNRGLFIDREHRCMLRRLEVQPNNVGGFGLELGDRWTPYSAPTDGV